MTGTCRSCKAPVIWARTTTDRFITLDPDPVEGGNIVVNQGVAVVLKKGQQAEGPTYVTHFASCPHADVWRRRAK